MAGSPVFFDGAVARGFLAIPLSTPRAPLATLGFGGEIPPIPLSLANRLSWLYTRDRRLFSRDVCAVVVVVVVVVAVRLSSVFVVVV